MWETMGPIADRSRERLGVSDVAIVEFRRIMVDAVRSVRDWRAGDRHGRHRRSPHVALRSFEGIVSKDTDWKTLGTGAERHAARANRRRTVDCPGAVATFPRPARMPGVITSLSTEETDETAATRKSRHARHSPSALAVPVYAQDTLKVAAGQRGNWDTSIAEIGQRAGIFKKHGLVLEILYTQGGGETQQAVISGSVDIGVAAGVMGVLSAYLQGRAGAHHRCGNHRRADLFWYVPADSPIKSLKDTDGKTIAYSTNGSSTHGIVTAFMKQYDLKAKPTATGGPAPTLTQVMSNQIDVGWSAPPFGLAAARRQARFASSRAATTRRCSRARRCAC